MSYPDPIVTPQAAPDPARLSPSQALTELLAGNRRFVQGTPRHGHHLAEALAAAGGPRPIAAVLGCLDPRVPPEAVFDQGFGAICGIRSAGHVLDRSVLGSVAFAVAGLQVPLVMVLGHQRCRAIEVAIEAVRTGVRPAGAVGNLVDELTPVVRAAGSPALAAVTREHVHRTAVALRRLDALRADDGTVTVVGAVYQVDSGRVELLSRG